jgi:hypothetical protein
MTALSGRPVVNVYDLADLSGCNVFVNWRAMVTAGYWEDLLAMRGLLAHEHAHPLAENESTLASRHSRLRIADCGLRIEEDENSKSEIQNLKSKIVPVLTALAEKLCLFAPREIFANEMTIQSGFAEALLHLNLRNAENASSSVAGRGDLARQLEQEMVHGNLTPIAADLLLLAGDLNSYLPLALEIAPFYRAGRAADARALEAVLETAVFPCLDPLAAQAFNTLREHYITLQPNLTPAKLIAWDHAVLNVLTGALAGKGLTVQVYLWMDNLEGVE